MKKRAIIFSVVAATVALFNLTAIADEVGQPVADTFESANKWLAESNLSVTGDSNGVRNDAAAFQQDTLLFAGEAVGNPAHATPAQREMQAKEAAVAVAQQALAQYLNGFSIVSDKLVKDGMMRYHSIRTAVSATLRNVQVVYQAYDAEQDKAIAIVKLGLHGPDGFATELYKSLAQNKGFQKQAYLVDGKPAKKFAGPAEKVSGHYDGLIIDASGLNLKPALFNRILTASDELLYDPTRLSQQNLAAYGSGKYADSVENARLALQSRGVKEPLVIKAVDVANGSDLRVDEDDAVQIFSANQKGKFLTAAKVAFVVN